MRRIWLSNIKKYAIVDDEDYERASQHTWCGARVGGYLYCLTSIVKNGKKTTIYLHRFITKSRRRTYLIDGNGLNCRKSNLSPYRSDVKGKMTDDLKAAILGMLLGDASASVHRNHGKMRFRLGFVHGEKQKDYIFHKAEILSDYVGTEPKRAVNGGYGEYSWTFRTRVVSDLDFLDMCCNKDSKKYVSQEWVDQLTLTSLAYWYMDDGTLSSGRYMRFATHNFSRRECDRLVRKLKAMGYNAKVWIEKKISRNKEYPVISLDYFSSKKLLGEIDHLIHECLKYKTKIMEELICECDFCGDKMPVHGGRPRWRSCSKKKCTRSHRSAYEEYYYRTNRERLLEKQSKYYARKKLEGG